jgi:hypothetical protein
MRKTRSVNKDWEFVSKGTEISIDWEETKEEAMEKVRGRTTRPVRADLPRPDEVEVEKSFWFIRTDGWVVNRKMRKGYPS